jgi:hypothetical protein
MHECEQKGSWYVGIDLVEEDHVGVGDELCSRDVSSARSTGGGEREGNSRASPEKGSARGRTKVPEATQIPRVECLEVDNG